MMIDKTKMTGLYNGRYHEFGRDIRTVGWGSKRDQFLRFEVLFRGLNPKGKTILDVGCGLGDLISFLDERTAGDYCYVGVDVADRLIEDARKTFTAPNIEFHVGDVFSASLPKVDISVLSGALSFKVDGIEKYAHDTMRKMFELSREAACLNFLTKYVDYELEKNQHYYPESIFSQAKELSRRVNLIHDYLLYEFTVQIFK
ncbi:MAG: hypothetical protein A2W05_09750 [Candidatus Schekmanbacteria bacterium RBG_16_38_10]|uniref:Methyltransferase domain-containing protein n=1 Tax=Candidatus Schekmanbacteria bacterium RBG_16_38_10 TaxID=1817879 RepID=A0A1F7RXI3_9BACT|nr:MAG: hypothetical protein A2W05_09750 [Candidatus Schekmanbacteria bacterium RBG_16_38_10]